MSAVTNRRIFDDESAGVCCFCSHNTTVGGKLANKKATYLDIRPRPHLFLVFKPRPSCIYYFNILFSYLTNMANNNILRKR